MKTTFTSLPRLALAVLAGALSLSASVANADGNHKKAHAPISTETHSFGQEGDPKRVTRTINVDMHDNMRYTPSDIKVKQGDTIKFVVHNKGKAMHEMVLGSKDELKAHGEAMKKNPGMEHDDPYMTHVKPGGKEVMVWKFTKPGEFSFGCLAPGHFEAGMIGKITVAAK